MILALLLLAAVTASTIGTAVTISSTTGQSKNIDNFILASLAGDAGVERNLAIVKYYRNNNSLKITDAINRIKTVNALAQPISTGSSTSFKGTANITSDPILVPIMRSDERIFLDSFEYNSDGTLKANSTANFLYIKGETAAISGGLEVSWILIDQSGDSTCTGRYFLDPGQIISGVWPNLLDHVTTQAGGSCTSLTPRGFRIGLRAVNLKDLTPNDTTIQNLTAEVYPCNNATCSPIGVPGRIQIDITGLAGASQAPKTASVLWQLPSSGLFNYVLFSEGDIIAN